MRQEGSPWDGEGTLSEEHVLTGVSLLRRVSPPPPAVPGNTRQAAHAVVGLDAVMIHTMWTGPVVVGKVAEAWEETEWGPQSSQDSASHPSNMALFTPIPFPASFGVRLGLLCRLLEEGATHPRRHAGDTGLLLF